MKAPYFASLLLVRAHLYYFSSYIFNLPEASEAFSVGIEAFTKVFVCHLDLVVEPPVNISLVFLCLFTVCGGESSIQMVPPPLTRAVVEGFATSRQRLL